MYRYRHGYAKSSCPKRDIQVKVWTFYFCVLLFGAVSIISDGVLCTGRCRLGSDAGRSVSPYPGSENGNASDHNAPLPPPGPKKKGRPPKNKPKGTTDGLCVVVHVRLKFAIFLSFPVPATSNDDGDVLSTRKRVCDVSTLLPLWITG